MEIKETLKFRKFPTFQESVKQLSKDLKISEEEAIKIKIEVFNIALGIVKKEDEGE